MKNGKIYTKEYNDGDRCVFKYKAPADDKDMVKVYYFTVLMDEIGCEEPERGGNTEIYIGTEHTSADSIIRDATEFEIKFLNAQMTYRITGLTIKKIKTIPKILPYHVEHCAHCPLRSAEKCYMNTVKNVLQNYYDKTLHEECPLRDDFVIEVKLKKE